MRGLGGISLGAAGLVLAIAAAVFGATTLDALRVQELPGPSEGIAPAGGPPEEGGIETPPAPGEPGRPSGGVYPRVTETELLDAVNQDLFQPDRTPPMERYQLPSEQVARTAVQQDPRRRRGPEFRVVGSAIMGNVALALVQVDDSIPLALLLGESVEGYTLAAVNQEGAVLVGETETLTLPVVEPLSTGGARNAGPQIQIDQRNLEAMQERVQQLLRNQILNQRGGMMQRGGQLPPPGGGNPPDRGGRGGSGGGGGQP